MSRKLLVALPLFAVLLTFGAFVCDDAFITFRSADNFVRGFGLRWNVGERVQVCTSPLFALLVTVPYALVRNASAVPDPGRAYWLAIALSLTVSRRAPPCSLPP